MKPALAALCALVVAGCVAVPRATHELDGARAAYRDAAANPQVQARAPVELELAERSLGDAERFHKADADPAMVAHFAYLAAQRSRIAVKTAELRAAEAAMATAASQRHRMHLELSARERAQADLQLRQQQARLEAAERAAQFPVEMSALKARQTERGWVVSFGAQRLFEGASAALTPVGRKSIENLAQVLQKQPARGIAIEGYADSSASPELGKQLSQARTEAVKQLLIEGGIEPGHIWTRPFAYPVGADERVEIVVAPAASAAPSR